MNYDTLIKTIEKGVKNNTPNVDFNDAFMIKSAVFIPLLRLNDNKAAILLTIRAANLKQHSGEISFPGGVVDKSDKSLEDTAIRETCEELGVKPEDISIIAPLDRFFTLTGYSIQPFIGTLSSNNFNINRDEIAKLIYLDPEDVLNGNIIETDRFRMSELELLMPAFNTDAGRIWGATARILSNFFRKFLSLNINLNP